MTLDPDHGGRLVAALADRGVDAGWTPRDHGDRDDHHPAVFVVELGGLDSVATGARIVALAPATATVAERVAALDAGADHCVAATVEVAEIAALVAALLRRDAAPARRSPERLLSGLAHDLRGPLQAVTLGTSMVAQNPALGDADQRVIRRIESGARDMAQLIDHVSTFARLQSGPLALSRGGLDLVGLLAGLVQEALARDPTRSIQLRGPASLRGEWDGARLTQAFEILLTAALVRRDAVVTLTIEGDADATVTFATTGAMEPGALAAVFADPLGAPPAGAAPPSLGLFLAAQIVRAHGGTARVASEVAVGTSFIVQLPARAARPAGPGA